MTTSLAPSSRPRRIVLALALAAGVVIPTVPAQAGCHGCGFHQGLGFGGLALGALAATMAQPNPQPVYEEPQDYRQRPVRLRERQRQALDAQDVAPEPRQRKKPAAKPAPKVAEKPAAKTRTVASQASPASAGSDSPVTTASAGALLP